MSDADMFILFLVIFKKKTQRTTTYFLTYLWENLVLHRYCLFSTKKMSQMKEKNQGAFQNLPTFQPFLNEIIF